MRIKTNAVPELELTQENGLLVKKGNAVAIAGDTFELLTTAYKNVKAENGDKAVMTLGEGKSASTFFFAYDEDSKQKVLFVDGYLVTKILTSGNKINVYTTNSVKPYQSFEEEELITKKIADFDNAIKAEEDVKASKQEVINYFNVKKVEEPILMQAKFEVNTREEKIEALKEEIKGLEKDKEAKEAELRPFVVDNSTTQNNKEVKKINKELDAIKANILAKNNEIIALDAQLNKAQDDKLGKKLDEDIKEYNKTIEALEKTKKENYKKIVDANARIELVQKRADRRIAGEHVDPDNSLKTEKEYRKEIEKLNKENIKIEAEVDQLKRKIKDAQRQANRNLGYIEQLKKVEEEYDKNMAKVAPKSDLAKAKIDEIEKANYDEVAAKPEGVKKDTAADKAGRIENAKYEAATKCLEKEINEAAENVKLKENARRDSNAGNIYVRAKEIIAQPKYAQLYDYLNGYTPVFWGTDITLKDKPGYGCLVVGPKLNEDQKITGMSKNTLNRVMYIVVGKTINEIRKSLPATAEDFLNIEGAKVYAARDIHSKTDYTKAYAEVYESTETVKDEKGKAVLDSTGHRQFVPTSKMIKLEFDIKTEEEIADFNKEQAEKAKKNGKKAEERVVDFVTPDMLKKISIKLGQKDCLDAEESSYWKYDYTKKKVLKVLKPVLIAFGFIALAAATTYAVVKVNNLNSNIAQLKGDAEPIDTDKAFESGKTQIGDRTIDYTYDKFGNVIMVKTNSVELTKDIKPYEGKAKAKGWTECGALYQLGYNTTMKLGKEGNILTIDGEFNKELFKNVEIARYLENDQGAPRDEYGNVIIEKAIESFYKGCMDAAKELEKTNPETAGTSAVDPQNEELINEIQKRINKDTKDTNKAMVVGGVYVDFDNNTAFAVSENGKNIVKLTYQNDIKNLDDAISGVANTTTGWYTCAAANPYLPGVKYQNYYVSDDTNINGDVYSKNFIRVEKEDADYTFTEFKGFDVLNEETSKMPSMNKIAYVSLAGTAAHNIDGYTVYGNQGDKTVYTATTPAAESTTAATVGQIFNFEK